MGKLDSTGTLAQTRGRQGGLVVSSNQSGSYARAWFMPRRPRTPAQLAWARNWQIWARSWFALSAAQRSAWDSAALASTWTRADWFGQDYQPSGYNLWMMIAAVKASLGQSTTSSPPTGTPPGAALSASISLDGFVPGNLGKTCIITMSQPAPYVWTYIQFEASWLIGREGAAKNKPYRPLIAGGFASATGIDATAQANEAVGWIYAETRLWYRYRGWTTGFLPSPWLEGYAG